MSRKQLKAALDLVRRMPPSRQTKTLAAILTLVPKDEFAEELLADVDQPLKEKVCAETGQPFIICEFNRDADSFRSPWSNSYVPELEDGITPSARLRAIEVDLNNIFTLYTKQYFGEEGLSSVYCWDSGEPDSWACAVLIRKDVKGVGTWNSMHVITVQEYPGEQVACYQMTTSIMLRMTEKEKAASGKYTFKMAGNIAKQWKQYDAVFAESTNHTENIGNYVQHYENKIRGNLPDIYFGKSMQVTSEVRSLRPDAEGGLHMLTMQPKPKKKKVWRQYADDNGDVYWYNTVTGESQWEPPENPNEYRKEKKSKKDKKQKHADPSDLEQQKAANPMMGALAAAAMEAANKRSEASVSAARQPEQQPQHPEEQQQQQPQQQQQQQQQPKEKKPKKAWKQAVAANGQPYWYNRTTGETSWNPPPEEAAAATSQPTTAAPAPAAAAVPSPAPAAAAVPSPAPAPAASRPAPTATVAEVCAWVKTLGLAKDYSTAIEDNAIDGEVLGTLTEAELEEAMGISAFGDKRKIGKAMGWR